MTNDFNSKNIKFGEILVIKITNFYDLPCISSSQQTPDTKEKQPQ
jgi:hypothetical protein